MTQQHPITPPPHLIEQWMQDHSTKYGLARKAARWGADQELEACCEWLKAKEWIHHEFSDELRAARRPKPPSLKEQALTALEGYMTGKTILTKDSLDTIRRALEQLDD
jgi:hypothetical protein